MVAVIVFDHVLFDPLMIDNVVSDLRFALRMVRRAPRFTVLAVMTLAVGIAGISTIFSVANAVYLKPLPYVDARRVVAIGEDMPHSYGRYSSVSPEAIDAVRQLTAPFERVSAYVERTATLMTNEPVWIVVLRVDSGFMNLLQPRPILGRLLVADEIRDELPHAMISEALWRTQFGGDSTAVGRRIELGGDLYTVVGVLPAYFRFPWRTDVWLPMPRLASAGSESDREFGMIGKLRIGVTRADAGAQLLTVGDRIARSDPRRFKGMRLVAHEELLDRHGYQFMPAPSLFFGIAVLVLLIACSNVTNLFLSRATVRQSEMAVRSAIGGSRRRLVAQLLTESCVIVLAAAVIGTILCLWFVRLILSLIPTDGFPSWINFGLDLRALLFAIGIAGAVTLLVGLSPAVEGLRFELVRALKVGGDGGSTTATVSRRGRRGLVVQLSLAIVLFVATVLLMRSYSNLGDVDLGYPAGQIATVSPVFDMTRYPTAESRSIFLTSSLPGIQSMTGLGGAALRGYYAEDKNGDVSSGPSASQPEESRLFIDRDTVGSEIGGSSRRALRFLAVSDGYFNATRQRVVRGRALDRDDASGTAPVVVVSQQFARLVWNASDPLGHSLQVGSLGRPYTVVGVVSDVRDMRRDSRGLTAEPQADVYFSMNQVNAAQTQIIVRSDGALQPVRAAILRMLRQRDPTLLDVRTQESMASNVEMLRFETRAFGSLIGAFATMALFLAMIGVYGLASYTTSQRRREIAVRIALGGTRQAIVGMLLRESLVVVAIGLAVGVTLTALGARVLKALLFGVTAVDPLTYLMAVASFAGITLFACYLPARLFSRVDPIEALRVE